MEAALVSASHGVMGSLLGKLRELLTAKYKLLQEARGQIMFLKAELESMHAFLKKISDTEEPDDQDKCWAKEVRELSYDIEDSVNEFMLRVERDSSKPRGFKGFISRSTKLLTTMNVRHDIAKEFEGLKIRVKEASERRTRYKLADVVPRPNNTTVDLRLLALHAETTSLVGVKGPRHRLIQLMDGEGDPAHQLKVLSIVGFGGLGKTTLANEIYRKVEGKFQCQAFVSVSQRPNMRKILRTILSQLRFVAPKDSNMEIWEESELISALQKFLLDKRYIIVIDDIWDASAWAIVRCALPENMNGSRVITTTRIETVARACSTDHIDYVYKMKALSDPDSRILFFKRIFGSEDACLPYLKEVSVQILKKCSGLPLAVITISSLLANQPHKLKEHWEYVLKSLGSNFEVSSSLNGMRQILNLSYTNLPHCLKTCMLYLSIYPEDYIIDKDDLTRKWVAEGFINKVHGMDPEDVAKSYFNELINRSLIQPSSINTFGEVMSCRVHDMMLDLILVKSREENFVTVIDDMQDMAGQCEKIRRLSLNLDGPIDESIVGSVQLSQVRMLARFGTSSQLPPFLLFKYLQVLTIDILERQQASPFHDFTGIGHCLHLRFIKIVTDQGPIKLPSKIGGLHQLETFHIMCREIINDQPPFRELPTDIVHMNQLLHLMIPHKARLPNGIKRMKSLRTLHSFNLCKKSADNIKDLGELTNLTDLDIRFNDDQVVVERGGEVMRTCLEKLSSLKYLAICTPEAYLLDACSPISASFCHLQVFKGFGLLTVPGWIGELRSLFHLDLTVKEVSQDDVVMLSQLPSLVHLMLYIKRALKDKILICGVSGFPVLKNFEVHCSSISYLTFMAGAMAKLERLEMCFNAHKWNKYGAAPAGMEHLHGLKKISIDIAGSRSKESDRKAAESALREAVDMLPSHPVARIQIDDVCWFPFDYMEDVPDEEDEDGGDSRTGSYVFVPHLHG